MKTITKTAKLAFVAMLAIFCFACEEKETITDKRDGKVYKTVKIGTYTWMAENLNFEMGESWCYEYSIDRCIKDEHLDSSWCYKNGDNSCKEYGRLYAWDAAVKACPAGWHLPSNKEWDDLGAYSGGLETAATKLKSETGWAAQACYEESGCSDGIPGTDDYGFSALPGGYHSESGYFYSVGQEGYWWMAKDYDSNSAYCKSMSYHGINVHESYSQKSSGFSVRCVKD
jgi:uncharacterized protein (TIGR02145 family)